MPSDTSHDGGVAVNLKPDELKEFLGRVAGADGDVVFEFKKDDGGNIDRVVEITEHVRELESQLDY
jgi:hypothetical protein